VSLGNPNGAAGTTFYPLVMTNVSATPCRLSGYPGVSLVGGGSGQQVGAAAVRTQSNPVRVLTLKPGQRAHATLGVATAENYPPKRCQPTPANGFRVYPPNQTRSAYVAQATTGCRNTGVTLLQIAPMSAGS